MYNKCVRVCSRLIRHSSDLYRQCLVWTQDECTQLVSISRHKPLGLTVQRCFIGSLFLSLVCCLPSTPVVNSNTLPTIHAASTILVNFTECS